MEDYQASIYASCGSSGLATRPLPLATQVFLNLYCTAEAIPTDQSEFTQHLASSSIFSYGAGGLHRSLGSEGMTGVERSNR